MLAKSGPSYFQSESKELNLRVGQRVMLTTAGAHNIGVPEAEGFTADVSGILIHPDDDAIYITIKLYDYTPSVIATTDGHPVVHTYNVWINHYIATQDAGLLPDAVGHLLKRLRGKPYLPFVDPPRTFGAGKERAGKSRKSAVRSTLASTTVKPTITPIGESHMTTDTSSTNAALAAAIASVITDSIPNADSLKEVARQEAEGAIAKLYRAELEPKVNDITLKLANELERVRNENVKLVKNVTDAITSGGKGVAHRARRAMATTITEASGKNVIVDSLSRFYSPGVEAPCNVLLASPPSFGKSYSIRLLGEEYDLFLEHGCSDDMDEISTLLGSPVPDGKGGFIVVDGVLTEAVRSAAAGKTVLLLLDEVLRLTPRAQEWLLTFLTGVKKHDGSRSYRLRTRRAMPDGNLEVIECATTHLHIVAATNLSILNPIEAFWSRWETVRVEFTLEQAQATAQSILDSYQIADHGRRLAKNWASIVKESRDRVAKGELRFPVDFRILERAAAMVDKPTSGAVARFVMGRLADNVANWNPDTGDIAPDGSAAVVAWQKRLETLANEEDTRLAAKESK